MKSLNFLRTRSYSLEQKYKKNLYNLLLFLAVFACYWNCLYRLVLEHTFWALAKCQVRFSVLGSWKNRTNMGTKWPSRIKK